MFVVVTSIYLRQVECLEKGLVLIISVGHLQMSTLGKLGFFANSRLEQKCMTEANTLAYSKRNTKLKKYISYSPLGRVITETKLGFQNEGFFFTFSFLRFFH